MQHCSQLLLWVQPEVDEFSLSYDQKDKRGQGQGKWELYTQLITMGKGSILSEFKLTHIETFGTSIH